MTSVSNGWARISPLRRERLTGMVIQGPLSGRSSWCEPATMTTPLIPLVLASLFGALLGCLTGLVPGLHSNNVATVVGTSPGLLLGAVAVGTFPMDEGSWALTASSLVVACAVAHTVANIVPSIYLAVPEGDTALSVLPGHRMVMAGRGDEALKVSVASSSVSLLLALVMVVPMALMMRRGAHGALSTIWGPLLLGVSAVMVLKESDKEARSGRLGGWWASFAALTVLLASGALGGIAVFRADQLAPMFIGLFGVPLLLVAMVYRGGEVPPAAPVPSHRKTRTPLGPILRGSIAGSLVGWFPGVSSAQATVLAVVGEVDLGDDLEGARRFIAGVSAVNTANAVFTIVALATFLHVRSGSAAAVSGLVDWRVAPWSEGLFPGTEVAVLLAAAALGGGVAAPVTLLAGRAFQRVLPLLSDRWALLGLLLLLVTMAAWAGGTPALLVLVASSALGMVPPLMGLMRVHLMGALTLPLAMGLILG